MAERHERHGWAYDPEWRYFVHDGTTGQTMATLESVEASPAWGATFGLDKETVAWLKEHPTPGAYK